MFHLLLPPRLWLHEFAQWVREGVRIRVPLACCHIGGLRELIAQPGPIEPTVPGWQAPHFAQTLVVRFDSEVTAGSGQQLLLEHRPAANQLIASLVLGVGAAAGIWSAAVSYGGDLRPLDALRLIGPGMATLAPDRAADRAAEHAANRPAERVAEATPAHSVVNDWSRTRGALGADLFERVRQSRVALIGASRNGSFAAHAFAMLGVRSLILIDPDRDERHHLSATLGASLDGIDDWKVANRAASLRRIRPDLELETWNRRFPDRATLEAIAAVDLICTCTDDDLPRLAAARWANAHCRPHLDIGSGVFVETQSPGPSESSEPSGLTELRRKGLDVQLALPGEACLSCMAGLRNEASAQDLLDGPPGLLPNEAALTWDEQRAGSLPTINAIAANLGVEMWLELLAGDLVASRWTRIEWEGSSGPHLTHHAPRPGPCRVCRPVQPARRNA
jgi:molybdopterin/thiamine biosynthesis adenylyltransferase